VIRLVVVAGPTAVGKSRVALAVAEAVGGEIVSADSAQVYRGLDIGTDKPSAADRARVRHHLVDVCDPREGFSVARYQALAADAVAGVAARGHTPLLVGGTGLYIRALVRGVRLPAVPPDPELRRRLEALPLDELAARLEALDPGAPGRVDLRNRRRVIRAIEICRATGGPLAVAYGAPSPTPPYDSRFFVLHRGRESLRRRIAARTHRILERGLVKEVARLLAVGVPPEAQSMLSLGYREAVAHLRGDLAPHALEERLYRATCAYARRQLTWFRREPDAVWLDLDDLSEAAAAEAVAAACRV
jgi:tRNA dimethylallyltransferase